VASFGLEDGLKDWKFLVLTKSRLNGKENPPSQAPYLRPMVAEGKQTKEQ
jgi:hypothetical protein